MRQIVILAFMAGYSCLAQTLTVASAISHVGFYDTKKAGGHFEKKYQPQ